MADDLKAQGNAAFTAGRFEEAVDLFTQAIEKDSNNHVLYSNRSGSKASLQDYEGALADARKTIELKSDWAKGYSRLAAAHQGLGQLDLAIQACDQGLQRDPKNAALNKAKADATARQSAPPPSAGGGMFGVEMITKLAQNPATAGYLSDPSFMAMLSDLRTNPTSMTKYMGDPRFNKAMEVALGVQMMSGDQAAEKFGGEGATGTSAPDAPPRQPEPAPEPEPEVEEDEETKQAKKRKADAAAEKQLGNAAYKRKDFSSALKHYDAAIDLDDSDVSFLTNKAAVHFETGNLEECIAACDDAIQKGRELRSDFKVVARAMARKGNALVKQGQLPEAIEVYNSALMEHRTADTLERLQAAEKALKAEKEAAYVDLNAANAEKEAGNTAFKAQDYPTAVKHYSEALRRGPPGQWEEAHKVYSNRAACYTKLTAFAEAEKDAEACIALAPDFGKGYSRKGTVLYFKKEYEKALEAYEAGLAVDPNSQELKDGRIRCVTAINRFMSGDVSEEERKARQQRAMQDPDIQAIMTDPVMQQVLKDFQENPQAAQAHLRNPSIAMKLQKLVAAGIVSTK